MVCFVRSCVGQCIYNLVHYLIDVPRTNVFLQTPTTSVIPCALCCTGDLVGLSVRWLVSRCVSPLLWSRLKCLNNYWMDLHEMSYRHSPVSSAGQSFPLQWNINGSEWDQLWYRHSQFPEDEPLWLWRSPAFSSRATLRIEFGVVNEMSGELLHACHTIW